MLQRGHINYKYYHMNSANQNLQAIRNKKALITKKYNEAKERLETRYSEDMAVLNEEERKLLEQFDDVPMNNTT